MRHCLHWQMILFVPIHECALVVVVMAMMIAGEIVMVSTSSSSSISGFPRSSLISTKLYVNDSTEDNGCS